MATSITLISSTTLTSSTTSYSFSSIPSTFTDLKLVYSGRCLESVSGPTTTVSFNSSTSTLASYWLTGDGGTATAATSSAFLLIPSPSSGLDTANTFGNAEIYIPNYTSSNDKVYSSEGAGETNATTEYTFLVSGRWSNSAAITSITLSFGYPGTRSWVANSSFYLYGIKNS